MEDYKKKYEDALERAKVWKEKSGMPINKQSILDDIFPELKKSEDKIFKELLHNLITLNDDTPASKEIFSIYGKTKEDCIAWLEKQDSISPTEDELEALRIAAYEPTKNWSEKLQSLYEKLVHCKQNPIEDNCTISDWDMKVDTIEYNNGYECGKQRVLKYPEDYGLCKKPAWKPWDEQMEVLYKYAEQNNYDGSVLTSLYRDLKKLKGE